MKKFKKLDDILDKNKKEKILKTSEEKQKLLQKQKEFLQRSSFSSLNRKNKLDMKKLHPIFIEFKNVEEMKKIATYLVLNGYKVYNYKKLLEEKYMKYKFFESDIEYGKYIFKRTNKSRGKGNVINLSTLKGVKKRIENKIVDPFGEEELGFEKIDESNVFNKLKHGDRVRIICGKYKDLKATVLGYPNSESSRYVALEFDERINGGHDCGNSGKYGYCYFLRSDYVEKIDNRRKILKPEEDPFGEEFYYESKKQKIKNYTDYILEEYEGGPPAKPQVTVKNKTVEWVLSDEEEEEPKELRILWNDSKLDNFE